MTGEAMGLHRSFLSADHGVKVRQQVGIIIGVNLKLYGLVFLKAANPEHGFRVHQVAPLPEQYGVWVAIGDVDKSADVFIVLKCDIYSFH